MKPQGKKIDFFKNLYEEARAYAEEMYNNLDLYYEQYKGSHKIDGQDAKDALVVRNITYELIESQVASYIPTPSVSPRMWSELRERNAKSIEMLLRAKRNELPYEKLNDMDERYTPIYGGSVWLVEWDESIVTHDTVGDIKVSCLNPKNFVGQPGVYEVQDMEYLFVRCETTKEEIVRRYGVSMQVAEQGESDENVSDKTATLYVCYYRADDDKVCRYVWSGDTELDDIDDFYARKRTVCTKCGKRKELCECEDGEYEVENDEEEVLDHDVTRSDGSVIPARRVRMEGGVPVVDRQLRGMVGQDGSVAFDGSSGLVLPALAEAMVPQMEDTRLPYYKPTMLPIVVRKNTSEEGNLLGQSDCAFIREQQQAINKIESRIMEKLLGSGVFPVVPEDAMLEMDDSIFKKVFRASRENHDLFGRIDLQVDITRDVMAADRLYDQAKRILGISDSFQGQYDASAQSGKAKQIQINQAAGRLQSKRQMKNAAYADIDKIIFQFYLAYADEPRPAAYRDAQGRLQNAYFNRYDFLEMDDDGNWYYDDGFLFAADASVDVETQRDTLWQENRANFEKGAYGDPRLIETLLIFWQNMERAHYPWAHENVERIKEIIQQQNQALLAQKE